MKYNYSNKEKLFQLPYQVLNDHKTVVIPELLESFNYLVYVIIIICEL